MVVHQKSYLPGEGVRGVGDKKACLSDRAISGNGEGTHMERGGRKGDVRIRKDRGRALVVKT